LQYVREGEKESESESERGREREGEREREELNHSSEHRERSSTTPQNKCA
jgi:hypothetical protein